MDKLYSQRGEFSPILELKYSYVVILKLYDTPPSNVAECVQVISGDIRRFKISGDIRRFKISERTFRLNDPWGY